MKNRYSCTANAHTETLVKIHIVGVRKCTHQRRARLCSPTTKQLLRQNMSYTAQPSPAMVSSGEQLQLTHPLLHHQLFLRPQTSTTGTSRHTFTGATWAMVDPQKPLPLAPWLSFCRSGHFRRWQVMALQQVAGHGIPLNRVVRMGGGGVDMVKIDQNNGNRQHHA